LSFDPRCIVLCTENLGLILKKLIVITLKDGLREFEINNDALADFVLKEYRLSFFFL